MAKYKQYFEVIGELIPDRSNLKSRPDLDELANFTDNFSPVVVPVPLWPKREKQRGFNQAEMIGRKLADNMELEHRKLLRRVRDTGRQVGRDRKERLKAINGAIEKIGKSKISDVSAGMIVDDVWTTGATLRECGKILKKAGVKTVWGFVLAR